MTQPEYAELGMNMLLGSGAQGAPRIRRIEEQGEELPELDELIDTIGELSGLLGPGRCAAAYQLYSPSDLPDDFADDFELVDVRGLLRRLLRYLGEDDESLPIELVDGRAGEASDFSDHLAGSLSFGGLTGEERDRLSFVVFDLGDLRAMLGPCCVELARAMVYRARMQRAGAGYREQEGQRGEVAELPSALEGFLACYALGFGLPVTNACLDPRSAGETRGNWGLTAWVSSSLSYPPDVAAYLLALIFRAGSRDASFVEARREALNPSQRELFDAAYEELEGEDGQLREELRWGSPDSWPEPGRPQLGELVFDDYDEQLVEAQERYREQLLKPNTGRPIFRARPRRTLLGMALGGVLGSILGAAMGVLARPVVSLIGAVAGALIGQRVRGSICSGPRCGAKLELDAKTCPKCGGFVAGEIERAKDHLAALEDWEEKAALEAG